MDGSSPVAAPVQKRTHEEKLQVFLNRIKGRKENLKRAAEKQRLRDVNKILSMISTAEGGINPFCIFPEEVWDIILSFLYKPEDLENARKTCKAFENLLEKRRFTDILLPKVFRIEHFRRILAIGIKIKWNPSIRNSHWNASNSIELIPEDNRYERDTTWDRQLQLKFRGLSQSLRHTIDTNMEKTLEQESTYQFGLEGTRYNFRKVWGLNFTSTSKIYPNPYSNANAFYSFMKNVDPVQTGSPAKELVGKTLKICFHGEIDYLKHMKDTTSFMDLVGDQILYFHVDISLQRVSAVEIYNRLNDWACRMPNMKWLNLNLRSRCHSREILNAAVRKRSFPTLGNLKRFSFYLYCDDDYESEVIVAIIDANQHLEELVIEQKGYSPKTFKRVVPFARALDLRAISFSTYSWARRDFEQLFEPAWPLRKIHFQFKKREYHFLCENSLYATDIFNVLQYYGKTLTHVAFDLWLYIGWEPRQLNLPNVTNFSIKFELDKFLKKEDLDTSEVFNTIDFLIPMKKLKEFTWINATLNTPPSYKKYPEHELIKFNAGRQDLKYSNIWDVFPKLKLVTVEVLEFPRIPRKTFRRENRAK